MRYDPGETELGDLRWHWDTAYTLARPEPDVWVAIRRDDHTTLRDSTPLGLRDRIIADYTARPVSRDASPPTQPIDEWPAQ